MWKQHIQIIIIKLVMTIIIIISWVCEMQALTTYTHKHELIRCNLSLFNCSYLISGGGLSQRDMISASAIARVCLEYSTKLFAIAYHDELTIYDLILKDAGTPFLGTPLPWLKSLCGLV